MSEQRRTGAERALLRQTVVLAHAVPGAELRMQTGDRDLVVSRHPSADVTPCQARAALLAAAVPGNVDCFDLVAGVELGGSLRDLGGGLYWSSSGPAPERWFATCLPPDDVAGLAARNQFGLPGEAITCAVLVDAEVAVSAVRLRVGLAGYEDRLDEVARWLFGEVLVEELWREALGASSSVDG
ncbi:hypothetical protein [Rhabdothermincola salaria]|uniref:hypothetical protein n=1 Tax=Rhabdothermincola salaria TaxID=2903142 RepID=UPI001E349A19|nr:hypothetical protein [Rhabdothermincola salaria]MCD9623993.1 hypothetical protein [Rhabdothermincola salaria]